MSRRKVAAIGSIVAIAVATTTLYAVGSASAASNYCGTGFSMVKSFPLMSPDGKTKAPGSVELFYNESSKQTCAVTLRNRTVTKDAYGLTTVQISPGDQGGGRDSGDFYMYAGPINGQAGAACVTVNADLTFNNIKYDLKPTKWCETDRAQGIGGDGAAPVTSTVAKGATTVKKVVATAISHQPAKKPVAKKPAAKPKPTVSSHQAKKNKAVDIALKQKGKRYVYAKAGPNTFDCSGLVMFAYKGTGIKIGGGHSAGGQYRSLKHISKSQAVKGDLVYYKSGHIGIYLGGGKMIHAANPRRGVVINDTSYMKGALFARV